MSRPLVLCVIVLSVAQLWNLALVDANLDHIEEVKASELREEVQSTLVDLATSLVLLQKKSGEWDGILEGDPSYDALMLILGQQLGTLTEALKDEIFDRIFRWEGYQNGLWLAYPGGAPSLDVTGVVLYGLKAAGLAPDDSRVRGAWSWFEDQGGWKKLHPLNQFFLAVGGSLPPEIVPFISPKFFALPKWFPINIYNIGIMRIAIAPLAIWSYYKKFPSKNYLSERLGSNQSCPEGEPFTDSKNEAIQLRKLRSFLLEIQSSLNRERLIMESWRDLTHDFMIIMDEHVPFSSEFWAQIGICWLLKRQQVDGTWGGVLQSTYLTIFALSEAHQKGDGDFRDEITHAWHGLLGWRRFIPNSEVIQQLSEGPIMETARILTAFYAVPSDLSVISDLDEETAIDWLVQNQIRKNGDWSYNLPSVSPGGWAYQYHNGFYPDTDDTAMVLEALARSHYRYQSEIKEAIHLGTDWVLAMQNADGGFPVWTHETSPLVRSLFALDKTLAALSDPSQVDVTARILKALAELKNAPHLYDTAKLEIAIENACDFIFRKAKKIEGVPVRLWEGDWMVAYLYGTAEVLDSLLKVGCWRIEEAVPYINWLSSLQNEDGGWGESQLSFVEERYIPAHSSIGQTAFALKALLTYERERKFRHADTLNVQNAILRGIQYLLSQSWNQNYLIERDYTAVVLKNLSYGRYYRLAHYETVRVLGEFLSIEEPLGAE